MMKCLDIYENVSLLLFRENSSKVAITVLIFCKIKYICLKTLNGKDSVIHLIISILLTSHSYKKSIAYCKLKRIKNIQCLI